MVLKSVLEQAKSFLCWDKYPTLNIKLISLNQSVGFFFPPHPEFNTILIFYQEGIQDFSEALFLLFHETGHYIQHIDYQKHNQEKRFWELVNSPQNGMKMKFETEAWENGRNLFQQFIKRKNINVSQLCQQFEQYQEKCLQSYQTQ